MRFESLRTMLALAAIHNWEIRQMDVKMAFLNGKLQEEIYMRQPAGFTDGTERVCRLRRSIYGLKQAGNVWNKEWNRAMEDLGFTCIKTDYCCFRRYNENTIAIILIWVDDLVIFTNNKSELDRIERELKSKFEISVIGEPSMLLGMKITRDCNKRTITLSQAHYIDQILKRFGLQDANPVQTPIDPNINLDTEDTSEQLTE